MFCPYTLKQQTKKFNFPEMFVLFILLEVYVLLATGFLEVSS